MHCYSTVLIVLLLVLQCGRHGWWIFDSAPWQQSWSEYQEQQLPWDICQQRARCWRR